MFLPTSDVDCFVTEVAERIHEADMFDRYVGTPRTALSHLATTPSGFKSLMGEPLDTFFQFSGIIHTLCVVDITCNGRFNFRDLENASKYRLFDLEGAPNALLHGVALDDSGRRPLAMTRCSHSSRSLFWASMNLTCQPLILTWRSGYCMWSRPEKNQSVVFQAS
jgi:hypothetical protein